MEAPRPVPDLATTTSAQGVTDEDRNRFGVLLDHAAERGLLSATDYQIRLAELADATSVEELQRLVTDYPAFGGAVVAPQVATAPREVPGRPVDRVEVPRATSELDAALWASLTPTSSRRSRGTPWVILAVMVVVLLAALIGLALVASHVTPAHAHALGAAGGGGFGLSRLRL